MVDRDPCPAVECIAEAGMDGEVVRDDLEPSVPSYDGRVATMSSCEQRRNYTY